MKPSYQSILEKIVPEVDFLSATGAGVRPGTILESLEKDIEIGYLPKYLKGLESMTNENFKTKKEPYQLSISSAGGKVSHGGALKFMDTFGLKYQRDETYQITFKFNEVSSVRFANDLSKIDLERALAELKKQDRKLFARIRGHFVVLRVLYAKSYEINIEVEKNGSFEASGSANGIEAEAEMRISKKDDMLLVSNNYKVPFGVIAYKIKGN